ncbi:hypothetical protein [Gulosibacter molinativorax]|uniref:Uncharacterized protein n=1 Tax=Gulosibacter molinativorax TaxID=256821 RepID=A0ABT7CAG3_9MICO|nr:hypothetical protein [Gulosibacter molinativorax]MDJ1371757.1 hypothetical protein [Gulosibacter molinativorax]QUY60877.1 Hypotetical protein [Gulosibacter molinativorax]
MSSERITDERLAECMEYATHEADMAGNAARVNPDHVDDARFYRNLEAALAELQAFRAREAGRDEHGLPTRLGAAIKFEGLANVFVRHSTYQPYPWTDGQAFLDSEEVLEIGEGCGPWKVVQDDD